MLFRRKPVGVWVGDEDEFDLVNGGTSENRRVGFDEAAERNNVFTPSLSINARISAPLSLSVVFR